MSNVFLGKPSAGIEAWIKANIQLDKTVYKVQTTSSYKKTGIYSAERDDTSKLVTIDWGDGMVEEVNGNISQKTHTYDSVGEFTVKVSNIKTFAASSNNSTWRNTTSQNRHTFKELVSLNRSVTSIGDSAFSVCISLTSVTIGNSVTTIGNGSFSDCTALESVTIPDSVTSIGENAFSGCSGLTSVTIGNGVTSIEGAAFYNCSGLTSVVIPESVTSIGVDAFVGCNNLLTVEFNGNAPAVGDFAFDGVAYGCKALVSSTATGFPAEGETWNGLVVEYK